MIKLNTPLDNKVVSSLKIGDRVLISGIIATGRDEVHKYLFSHNDKKIEAVLKNSIIYHSGPIVKEYDGKYEIVSCGPTTSIREEPYQAKVMKRYRIKGIIGKGGMGEKTQAALKSVGGVYLSATGGAAALLAKCVEKVIKVYLLKEFGVPEAMWVLRVKDFPAIVTMDSHGDSLHKKVFDESSKHYKIK